MPPALQNFTVLLELVVKDRTQAISESTKKMDEFSESTKAANRQLSYWTVKRTGEGITKTGTAMISSLGGIIKTAADFQSAGTSLAAVLSPEGGKLNAGFQTLLVGLKEINKESPKSLQEIAGMATEAARAGLNLDNGADAMLAATRGIARASTALGIEGGALTGFLTASTRPFFENAEEAAKRFDNTASAVFFSANQFAKATPQRVFTAFQRIGKVMSDAKFKVGESAALISGAFMSGLEPERLGTTIGRLVSGFGRVKNLAKVGSILGTTASELRAVVDKKKGIAGYGTGIQAIFKALVPKLKEMKDSTRDATLEFLGITQQTDKRAFNTMIGDWEKITEVMGKANEEFRTAKALDAQFIAMKKDLNAQLQFLNSNWTNLRDTFGRELLPIATAVVSWLKDMVAKVEQLNPVIRKLIMGFIGGAGVALVVIGAIITAIAGMALAWLSFGISADGIKDALTNMNAGFKAFTATVKGNIAAMQSASLWSRVLRFRTRMLNRATAIGIMRQKAFNAVTRDLGKNVQRLGKGFWKATTSVIKFGLASVIALAPMILTFAGIVAAVEILRLVFESFGITFKDVVGFMQTVGMFVFKAILVVVRVVANVILGIVKGVIGLLNYAIAAINWFRDEGNQIGEIKQPDWISLSPTSNLFSGSADALESAQAKGLGAEIGPSGSKLWGSFRDSFSRSIDTLKERFDDSQRQNIHMKTTINIDEEDLRDKGTSGQKLSNFMERIAGGVQLSGSSLK